MVYISCKTETWTSLREMEGYEKTPKEYETELRALNPHLHSSSIGAYTPLILVEERVQTSLEVKMFVRELSQAPQESRESLWHLQQGKIDMPTLVATEHVMEEFRKYSQSFLNRYNDPLIKTPWLNTGPLLTNGSLLDLLSGTSGAVAQSVYQSRHVFALDELFEAMCKRDAYNQEIVRLSSMGKAKSYAQIARLEKQVKEQTALIKQLLPKRIEETMTKYLAGKGVEVYKIRSNSYSLKVAKKGYSSTLKLDLLNQSGLNRAKDLCKALNKIGQAANKIGFWIGPAIVLYDTNKAYEEKKDFKRVFFSGAAGFSASVFLGSVAPHSLWGATVVATVAGNTALGATMLVSSPFLGTVLFVVVGMAVVGAVGYTVSQVTADLWDSKIGQTTRTWTGEVIEEIYEKLKGAWDSDYNFLNRYYGSDVSKEKAMSP